MIVKAIICAVDAFVAIACFAAAVADGTERKMRIVDLLIALGMMANIYMIWSMRCGS